uniref:Uncharacterized protein n=1 Tax=Bracon brevicornis TaxID=1563983 RepID=A0A6V7JTL7_9HYME
MRVVQTACSLTFRSSGSTVKVVGSLHTVDEEAGVGGQGKSPLRSYPVDTTLVHWAVNNPGLFRGNSSLEENHRVTEGHTVFFCWQHFLISHSVVPE